MVNGILILALSPILGYYLYKKLYHLRFKQLSDIPQLEPSLIWGHLKALNEFIISGEAQRHIDVVFDEVQKHLCNPPLFVFDLRPIQTPICVIGNYELAEQVTRSTKKFPYSIDKSPLMRQFDYVFGPHSILTVQGEEWRDLRKRFNPGFAPQHIMTLLPSILDKTLLFLDNLGRYAVSGEKFRMTDLCGDLTFDIVGIVSMDVDFGAQLDKVHQNKLVELHRQLCASFTGNTDSSRSLKWASLNPILTMHRRRLGRRVDELLKDQIRRKFEGKQRSRELTDSKKDRSILTLSLQDVDHLDAKFLDQTSDQLRTFLFAGNDTTNIVLQWALYEISLTPRVQDALRCEMDEIFGVDSSPTTMRDMLCAAQGKGLLSRMSYTTAVTKEVLRLHPPVGTARYMPPGSGITVQLPDDEKGAGRTICLDGMNVYNCPTIIHRDESIYGATKDDFIPERWLDSASTSQIPATAWRPFERGPRNCVGQELAMLEARVILAFAVRQFDCEKVGLGAPVCDHWGKKILNEKGQYQVRTPLYNVTAKPVDGTRMRVRYRRP